MVYRERTVDRLLDRSLGIAGAVLIEGVRACGKTATGLKHSASAVRFDTDDAALELAGISPKVILDGDTPRLFDEWQLAPQLWNHVKRAVDDRGAAGQFILTGSATPADDVTRHSGAGRILRIRMRTMSLAESGHSNSQVSLCEIMDGAAEVSGSANLEIENIAGHICAGGWPGLQSLSPTEAQVILRSYLEDVARADVIDSDGVKRDPARVRKVLSAYARHVSTPATLATISADSAGSSSNGVHVDTVRSYLDVLERVMVVEEQLSWGPHLRSRDVVRKGPIRHLVDPSLAVAALGGSVERLLADPRSFGLLFESLAIRDLRIYAQGIDGEIRHYRDSAGAEADAIIQLRNGRWAAVEVKLGDNQVTAAVESLHRLVRKIDTSVAGEPVALVVITGGKYAYTRPDGVHVVPIGCLAP